MRKGFVLLVLMLLIGMGVASAQSNDNPLLRMLARIPDSDAAREYLSYVDYQAIFHALPGAPEIASWQDFEKYTQSDSPQRPVVLAALRGVESGPEFISRALAQAGDMPSVVGFDLFAIDRALAVGQPPDDAVILEGDFDSQAVIAAHEKRGYTEQALDGFTLLCGKDGCDSGSRFSLADRNLANIFGGDLGRSQPVIVGGNLVASSTSFDVLTGIADSSAGKNESLADLPDYRAASEAISASGTLLQCNFVRPGDILPVTAAVVGALLSPDETQALVDQLQADFVPLPQYNLVVLADSATESEQQAKVALVYTNQADAEAAAALFPDRLEKAESLLVKRSFGDLLTDRGVTSATASVYTASKNRYVMVLTLHAPLAGSPAQGNAETMSQVYALLVQALVTRDLTWLATQF